jgi:DNA-directed RNA polymerase sigma subunit (sigma70/sigma32)
VPRSRKPPVPDLVTALQEVQAAVEQIHKTEDALEESRARLRTAVRSARTAGATLDQIGRIAGISRQRVAQIDRDEPD